MPVNGMIGAMKDWHLRMVECFRPLRMAVWAVWAVWAVLPLGPGSLAAAETAPPIQFEASRLAIEAASGRHEFTVELAVSPEQKSRGLMFRERMAPDAGMLFDFGTSQPVSFWMKNTLIPLDMIFITADGRIRNIAAETRPLSLEPVFSDGRVLGVLELNAGTAERLGIKPGDRVVHPIFGAP